MITTYNIIDSPSPADLTAKVAAALKGGFQPIGGVCAVVFTDHAGNQQTHLFQAIGKMEV